MQINSSWTQAVTVTPHPGCAKRTDARGASCVPFQRADTAVLISGRYLFCCSGIETMPPGLLIYANSATL